MLCVTECGVEVTSHRLALDLLEAWRGAAGARRPAAVTRRLADQAACGSPATVEQIVVALTALAGHRAVRAPCRPGTVPVTGRRSGCPPRPGSGRSRPACSGAPGGRRPR